MTLGGGYFSRVIAVGRVARVQQMCCSSKVRRFAQIE